MPSQAVHKYPGFFLFGAIALNWIQYWIVVLRAKDWSEIWLAPESRWNALCFLQRVSFSLTPKEWYILKAVGGE